MASAVQVPCNGDGVCMRCKVEPPAVEVLTCTTCATPWHVPCLSPPPETLASTVQWECPDCSGDIGTGAAAGNVGHEGSGGSLVAEIRAIEADGSLSEAEKAKKRQELLDGSVKKSCEGDDREKKMEDGEEFGNEIIAALGNNLKCCICLQLPDRPVTTSCGHNFCLRCFEKWIGQGSQTCAKCRSPIPRKEAINPRINSALVSAIRLAKMGPGASSAPVVRVYSQIDNDNRPDDLFTTERAKMKGVANACRGRVFVTVPKDHFGPIPPENDPVTNLGVSVGQWWKHRMQVAQWGVHRPHISGIAGQSQCGAQSISTAGGYGGGLDFGEWIIYTGSGGRDLSGNKRTSKDQAFDQEFTGGNQALRLSCQMGYPVRVLRSYKDKSSPYAPAEGFRYDGVYRVEKCWRIASPPEGFKLCRFLMIRCDNEPAPWTSDEHGDRPRPTPVVPEMDTCVDLYERADSPSWDFDAADGRWKWVKPPPASREAVAVMSESDRTRARKAMDEARFLSVRERLLQEFSCQMCGKTLQLPVTTPCAHNFCKGCLEGKFGGISLMRQRSTTSGRSLRPRKNVMTCPACPSDISDFLQHLHVNREMMDVIEKLKSMSPSNNHGGEASHPTPALLGDEHNGLLADADATAASVGTQEVKDSALNPLSASETLPDPEVQASKRIKLDIDVGSCTIQPETVSPVAEPAGSPPSSS